MTVRCPHCRHEQDVAPALVSREVACPSCNRRYIAGLIVAPASATRRGSGGLILSVFVLLLLAAGAFTAACWHTQSTPRELVERFWPRTVTPEAPVAESAPAAPVLTETPPAPEPAPLVATRDPAPEPPSEPAPAAPAEEKSVDYLSWLLADKTRWPRTVTLKEPVEFNIRMDGRIVGSVTRPADSIVPLVEVTKDYVVVANNDDKRVLAIEATDLLERARIQLARLAAWSAQPRPSAYSAARPSVLPSSAPSPLPRTNGFVHPGLPFTKDDLAQLKLNIKREPWRSAFEDIARGTRADYKMRGPFASVSRTPDINLGQYKSDMQAIYNLALMWALTGENAYGQRGRDVLMAWVKDHQSFDGAEMYLSMGDYAYRVFGGADILRGTWPGWTAADTAACKAYFEKLYWWAAVVPKPLRSANQGILQLSVGMGVAVFNDDADKFAHCVEAFRHDAVAGVADSLPNGEIGDSGRDQGHAYGQLQHLAWIAEIAWKQGVDLYAEGDNRLLAAGEFYARYNHRVETPFMSFGSEYDIFPGHGGAPESSVKAPDILNMIHAAYVVRKGLSAPYVELYRKTRPENPESFVYRKTADTSTASPLPPRTRPKTHSVTTGLTSKNIGDALPGGNTRYDHGTWTVLGGGSGVGGRGDSFRFVYLPITGDGAIIAQVTSVQKIAGDTQAGLVIRDSSSDPDAAMLGIYLQPEVTFRETTGPRIHLNMRGQTASSHNRTGQTHRLWDATTITIPYWLKLERLGKRITAFHSRDGASWSPMQTVDYEMGERVYAGLAVASRVNGTPATATFAHVRITGADDREPVKIPAAPFAIYASPGPRQVPLRWLEAFGATSYNVKRSIAQGGPYQTLVNTTGTSHVDTTVSEGRTYYYVVTAVNPAGEGPASLEDSATPVGR